MLSNKIFWSIILNQHIPDSHPALSGSTALMDYCGHFLKKNNLNYFQVIRVNQDGSTVVLTNRAEFTRFCIQHAIKSNVPLVYSSVNKEVVNASSYYFLWEPNLPIAPVAMVRNEFNMANGLTFVERFPTHYYMFAFAAPTENLAVLDFYLNNMDVIKSFIHGFKDQQQQLLKTVEKTPLILPAPLWDKNLENMLLNDSIMDNSQDKLKDESTSWRKIPVSFNGHDSYLTAQEYECIRLLPLGLSAKNIGRKLNISFRTVEKYFERIKARIGCSSKQELISLLTSIN
jgi:DNA-binding CsgD family transcriptional regulator